MALKVKATEKLQKIGKYADPMISRQKNVSAVQTPGLHGYLCALIAPFCLRVAPFRPKVGSE